ncbi:hypothetical protein GCM10010885_00340 [Alicyclobacillus cellulosilyticus]|uniref:Magnesium transporter MgtE intracellular domain-containing protein n=2 Tax=Alicyclobacillus cellulosilyticus TaxID=1003997 RepID=A0A917JZP1_9BACL|nr:hypothetical protein GCM10010885_00340 [Alicyclobacillus cellulosilyticus]
MFTVVLVPLLASALMVGVALQVVGVPVWQTIQSWLHPVAKTQPEDVWRAKWRADEVRVQTLTAQLHQAQQQLAALQQERAKLLATNRKLQQALAQRQASLATAKQEARVLQQMDPGAAAQVLDKMSLAAAARAVAQMPPDAAAQVLAALPPAKAQQVLAQSAFVKAQLQTKP